MDEIAGFLNIDKPSGMSSHDVVDRVRTLFKMKKVGHGGTLDPFATGVLVIALGRASKFLPFLPLEPKEYLATVVFGIDTDTLDRTGKVVWTKPCSELSARQVQQVLTDFCGEIFQAPPAYSAVKVNGIPLYRLARQGVSVQAKPRKVQVFQIGMLQFWPGEFPKAKIRVSCSSGTYVRALGADIAAALGTKGHLSQLVRTRVGQFQIKDSLNLLDLTIERAFESLVSLSAVYACYPFIRIKKQFDLELKRGCPLKAYMVEEFSSGIKTETLLRIIDTDDRFLGLAHLIADLQDSREPAQIVAETVKIC